MSFLNSIENKSKRYESPFVHWELNQPLTEGQVSEIVRADIDDPTKHSLNYDGTRAIDGGEGKFREGISDGGKALKFRCFITKENSKEFPNLSDLIEELQNKNTYERVSSLIGKNLSNSYVRVEVICDRKGFWLKPHCDIKEKLMSCLLFVNKHNESEDLGTDFYDNNFSLISQCGLSQNPVLSQITSTLTKEFDKSFFISSPMYCCTFFEQSSLIKFVNSGKFFEFSFVTKHLYFLALPPDLIPSLYLPSPPSIALVPSY